MEKLSVRKLSFEELSGVTFLKQIKNQNIKKMYKQQIFLKIDKLIQDLNKNNYQTNFLKFFKMQIQMTQKDFEFLKLNSRIRFLSFYFFVYVDRIRSMIFFKDIFPQIKLFRNLDSITKK